MLILEKMKASGIEPFVVTFNPELVSTGRKGLLLESIDVAKAITFLRSGGVKRVIIAGVVPKGVIFRGYMDEVAQRLLQKINIRDDHSLLAVVVSFLESYGFEVTDYREWIEEYIAQKGVLSERQPTDRERRDIEYGYRVAKDIARYSFGQSVVLKDGAVLAIEAIEGTDEAIKRAGKYAGRGAVVVKVIKDGQDTRYDLPTVGLRTIESMKESGATCLAVESGYTVMLDKEEMLKLADENGISVVGI